MTRILHILIHQSYAGPKHSLEKELAFQARQAQDKSQLGSIFLPAIYLDENLLRVNLLFDNTLCAGGRNIFHTLPTKIFTLATTETNLDMDVFGSFMALLVSICVDSIIGAWRPIFGLESVLNLFPPSCQDSQDCLVEMIMCLSLEKLMIQMQLNKRLAGDYRTFPGIGKFLVMVADFYIIGNIQITKVYLRRLVL